MAAYAANSTSVLSVYFLSISFRFGLCGHSAESCFLVVVVHRYSFRDFCEAVVEQLSEMLLSSTLAVRRKRQLIPVIGFMKARLETTQAAFALGTRLLEGDLLQTEVTHPYPSTLTSYSFSTVFLFETSGNSTYRLYISVGPLIVGRTHRTGHLHSVFYTRSGLFFQYLLFSVTVCSRLCVMHTIFTGSTNSHRPCPLDCWLTFAVVDAAV